MPPGSAASSPVRPPVQARSRRTLARILDASLTLLGERGRDGLTVQDVVSLAGTSVGSFYARFSGKEDLLAYVEETVWTRAREQWDEQISARIKQGDPLGDRVPGGGRAAAGGAGERVRETLERGRRGCGGSARL